MCIVIHKNVVSCSGVSLLFSTQCWRKLMLFQHQTSFQVNLLPTSFSAHKQELGKYGVTDPDTHVIFPSGSGFLYILLWPGYIQFWRIRIRKVSCPGPILCNDQIRIPIIIRAGSVDPNPNLYICRRLIPFQDPIQIHWDQRWIQISSPRSSGFLLFSELHVDLYHQKIYLWP